MHEVSAVARNKADVPVATTVGAGTVLPGVPLPGWVRPSVPIEPAGAPPASGPGSFEDPAAAIAAARAEAALRMAAGDGAQAPVPSFATPGRTDAASLATPVPAPVPQPVPAAPVPLATAAPIPVAVAVAAPVAAPYPTPGSAPVGPPTALPAPVPVPAASGPAPETALVTLGATAVAASEIATLGDAPAPAREAVDGLPHRHGGGAPEAPAARKGLFGRRRKETDPHEPELDTVPTPEALAPVALTAGAVATIGAPAVLDAPPPAPPSTLPVPEALPPTGPVDLSALPAPGTYAATEPLAAPAPPSPVDVEILPEAAVVAAEEGRRGRRAKAEKPAKQPQTPRSDVALDAPKTQRRPVALLAVVGAVVVLAAVAAFVWPGLLITSDGSGTATPVPVQTHPVTTPVTLQTPVTAAGLTKLTGPAATALQTTAAGATLAGFTAPVSAVYGTGTTPSATVIAWTAASPVTTDAVSTAFAGIEAVTGTAVTGVAPVATGTLGGQMRCGATTSQGKPATVCFWADNATFGAVTVLAPASPEAAATTAVALRQAVEKRG
jgi:hypothetical protein